MRVEVSNGELVDKVAVLEVKLRHILNPEKRKNLDFEYRNLRSAMEELGSEVDGDIFQRLIDVHEKNWHLMERWNELDQEGRFDDEYVEVTRASNECNRERFRLKVVLNKLSGIVEEKSEIYGDYTPR